MYGSYRGGPAKASEPAFLYADALSSDEDGDAEEAVAGVHEHNFVEVDQSLYTNALLSVMSTADNFWTATTSFLLLAAVAMLQYVLIMAIVSHVRIAMSWTEWSIKKQAMYGLYSDLLNGGRLNYLRLEKADVADLCGTFDYTLEETNLPGTNWSAYFTYDKTPVSSWGPEDIPPTDRSELDVARFVLENDFYVFVYIIVTFVWILSVVKEMRGIVQFSLAILQMPIKEELGEVLHRNGEELEILGVTPCAKTIGVLITLYRIAMTSLIALVGSAFLLWTSTDIELILNALALTFILELDHITYNATIYAPRHEVIARLKRLTWRESTSFANRFPNAWSVLVVLAVMGVSSITTVGLRLYQRSKYLDMFMLTSAICLFQGPTPGYWSRFHATFPAPGLCESLLRVRCESPIVGENGRPCVEDWTQRLCKFYVETGSMFNTWNRIDWQNQGPCLAEFKGGLHRIDSLRFGKQRSTFNILAETCQVMFQSRPSVIFKGQQRSFTGPRVRVYPYMDFFPTGPFWCGFEDGSSAVLTQDHPAPFLAWRRNLDNCRNSLLMYSPKTSNNWVSAAADTEEQISYDQMQNMTKDGTHQGTFSGIWLSKRLGIIVIAVEGATASVSNSNLPSSPVPAVVSGDTITIQLSPPWTGTLTSAGEIQFDNGDTFLSQSAAASEEEGHKHKFFGFPFR